jgi:superfamily II DNA or RNA helicase/crotonobetainyl-CoA:carnitine CoA-transferase CaiB-like acyl-CoA transferase
MNHSFHAFRHAFRQYQVEADEAIYTELLVNDSCLVKMFCGTGKSLLMCQARVLQNKKLVVYVFPSLCLIDQYYSQYVDPHAPCLRISCEQESTTNPSDIIEFLTTYASLNKIICVTYNSFGTLLENMGTTRIDVCVFDEAHHAVGETYQKLIFGSEEDNNEGNYSDKKIFFTATPKNANGIVMFDRDFPERNMCGACVFDYSYFTGVMEGYLNSFEIRIDLFLENTNASLYETIARAVLASGNSRVLTFHSDVNTERDTSVLQFVHEAEFRRVFHRVQADEFPLIKKYKKIHMVGLTASLSLKQRCRHLAQLDATKDNEVMVIASCETIGEGIDTKNANMCVFVDPKSSYVKIIQNIGRIVRKTFNTDTANATILIPCWVEKAKYADCDGDKEKCDQVIREDMGKGGNFNGILNVMSALKQEDEDIYDVCLHYPDTYSPQEIIGNLKKCGYEVGEVCGEGGVLETMEYLLDKELLSIDSDVDEEDSFDLDESEEDMILRLAEKNDVCVEIHGTSLETPIERYNVSSQDVIRMYRDSEDIYSPIVKNAKEGINKRNRGTIDGPCRKNRFNVNVHTNPDVQVYWKIVSDMTQDVRSCIIDCEVEDSDERWLRKLQEVDDYIAKHSKRPSNSSKEDPIIKILAGWINKQLNNYKNKKHNMKDETLREKWEAFVKKHETLFLSNEKEWLLKLQQADDYIVKNGKRPSSEDPTIKTLAKWIGHQQENYKKKEWTMKDETIREKWEAFVKKHETLFLSNEEEWLLKLQQADYYIVKNGSRPSTHSKNSIIKTLAKWIGHQQVNYKKKEQIMKDETIREKWEKFVKKYESLFLSNEEEWLLKLQQTDDYIVKNRKRPAESSKDPTIKTLANWINTQQQNFKKKEHSMKNDTIREKWEAFVKKHETLFLSNEEEWLLKLQQADDYITKNGTRHSTLSNDSTKTLASWINNQQRNLKKKEKSMKNEIIREKWEAFVKKHETLSNEEEWSLKLYQADDYITKEGKRPPTLSKDPTIKTLANWIGHQQGNYIKKENSMKNKSIREKWEEFVKKYESLFMSKEEEWLLTLQKSDFYIAENGKRPSQTAKDPIIKTLGLWIGTQQTNYKKREWIMKDETIREKWEEFVKKYQHLFTNSDSETFSVVFQVSPETIAVLPKPTTEQTKMKSMKLKPHPTIEILLKEDEKESQTERKQRIQSELSQCHQRYKTLKSENLHKEFTQESWLHYHALSEENEASFPEDEIPRNRIIQELNKIKTKRTKRVVDMGCGKGQISLHYSGDSRFQFFNYDHISYNDTIVSCDIMCLPLEDNYVEICILSLAMWGSNCKEYLDEAHRVLETGGRLYIVEPTRRWSELDEAKNCIVGQEGQRLKTALEERGFHIREEFIEKFCLIVCDKF